MFHQRNGRSAGRDVGVGGGGAGGPVPDTGPNLGVNGESGHAHHQQPQFGGYMRADREDKPRGGGWRKDSFGAWIRDKGGGSTSNLPSNLSKIGGSSSNLNLSSLGGGSSVGNSLRNRRRTNSNSSIYIPSLSSNAMNGDHPLGSPGGGTGSGGNGYHQRGSSASPRAPHSKGFWVQEPDDFHQRWVDSQTPVSEGNGTPLTWPPTGGGGRGGTTCSSQPSSPRKAPGTPPPLGTQAQTLPKVYKSQATWVSSAPTVTPVYRHTSCYYKSDIG
ncbi:unnamed protein product [Meganyctiphanes norvegica]|uniref:Uncharacterized protein n=1 Tax=Meganyctiphanes norvegica TaxID=48144 RepID=A0AAV2QGR2_MEGNR